MRAAGLAIAGLGLLVLVGAFTAAPGVLTLIAGALVGPATLVAGVELYWTGADRARRRRYEGRRGGYLHR